jgi:hypothetical protein
LQANFGTAHGQADSAKQADLSDKPASDKPAMPGKRSKHKKTPENVMFPRVSCSDADGTRTRNLRITASGVEATPDFQ